MRKSHQIGSYRPDAMGDSGALAVRSSARDDNLGPVFKKAEVSE